GWSIVIKSVTKLGIPTDHMCWFHMDSCRTIVCTTTCFRLLFTWYVNVSGLSIVHECHTAWNPMRYNRTCYDNTISVKTFNPIIVFNVDFICIIRVHPYRRATPKESEHRLGVKVHTMD